MIILIKKCFYPNFYKFIIFPNAFKASYFILIFLCMFEMHVYFVENILYFKDFLGWNPRLFRMELSPPFQPLA
ncbi:hypothetical protein BpHYR1_026511 [Brachionus plicatilis]|uniref:Uncharacterized protein n=1 Tax=Brachionus plicatilis TaxID=10195 RepID=A0A3M7PA70_BRAPC|nr:hypothetical protein BpHYR1_026511 [Brachionus plicatilis]